MAPQTEIRKNIDIAERDLESWRYATAIAEAEIPTREDAVRKAAERVDAAAKEVVRSEVDVARLIAEAEKSQAGVVERRLFLMHIDRLLPDRSEERAALLEFFAKRWLYEEMSGAWKFSKVAKTRLAAFEELKHNSDAEIPAHE